MAVAFSIESSVSTAHVTVRVVGDWTPESTDQILKCVMTKWLEHREKPLLVDVRETSTEPSVTDDWFKAEALVNAGFRRIPRIAVVDAISRRGANDFFATAAVNRGVRLRCFYGDLKDAEDWLVGR